MKVVGRKTARLVAGQIVQDIGTEGLTRLPSEAELLARYEVSRPSLREALRILEMYGVISIRPGPGGGTRVNTVASSQFASASSLYFHLLGLTLRDVLNTRLQVEPLMARLASERVKSGVPWTPDEAEGSSAENAESGSFHFSVARFTGDPILLLFADGLRSIYVDESADEKVPREELPVSHDQIADAIKSGDSEKSERLMRDHIRSYLDALEENCPEVLDQVVDWN
ncbi:MULTISPECIES: FadR/GntR family transcriptional regulator [unclassified Rhodococcus (in: high G+C Gram-positive bacteria)]|uniref:FadR/GntR family transcriptional regulator n=1 Tax=unclassified Rhodococcus (in: high G+C Gram-positive bacteria) TaxID=192944 RepID=UPI0020791341|nr:MULTISPECIES: FCD domain-containing protein [unclassified Rhodococcus (in: high G+C Gram-positive bacteria)]